MTTEFITKDSGAREEYSSGMRRDVQDGKPRFDLMLPEGTAYDDQFLTRIASLLSRGAEKYGDRNWELADSEEELRRFKASAIRHAIQWFTGEVDEDHAAATVFNLLAYETTKTRLAQRTDTDRAIDELRAALTVAPEPERVTWTVGDQGYLGEGCFSDWRGLAVEVVRVQDEIVGTVKPLANRPDGKGREPLSIEFVDLTGPIREMVHTGDIASLPPEDREAEVDARLDSEVAMLQVRQRQVTERYVHNHDYDPSCVEADVDGRLRGECLAPRAGDTCVILGTMNERWADLRVLVLDQPGPNGHQPGRLWVRPLGERPDLRGRPDFYWGADDLEVVQP